MAVPPLKHLQIEQELRKLARTLPEGARLPSEKSLATRYGCNFLTVRKAVKRLVADGLVTRRMGSGTFIARKDGAILPSPENDASPGQRQKKVGVLMPFQSNAYGNRLLQVIATVGHGKGIEISTRWAQDFREDGLRHAAQLEKEGCMALTLPWFPYEQVDAVKRFVQRSPLPVSLPIVIPGLEQNCSNASKYGNPVHQSTEAICSYYQALGARRIAFIGPDLPLDQTLQKALSPYVCRMSRDNLPIICGLVQPGSQSMDQLAVRWKELCGDLAIISYDDEYALRFMTAMHKLGLNAPKDYRIIGHNDTETSAYSDPPLSTIAQDFEGTSEWLLDSALALACGEAAQSRDDPKPRLIVRSTCGGQPFIDEAFRSRLPDLDIILAPIQIGAV